MRTLVAVDSSDSAENILALLAQRVWPADSQLKLVTAVALTGNWDTDQQNISQVDRIMQQRIKLLKTRLGNKVTVSGEVLEGEPVFAVNQEALNWRCDHLVIGAHGDTGARKPGLGGVAGSIVNQAPCSVEVLKFKRPSRKSHAHDATSSRRNCR